MTNGEWWMINDECRNESSFLQISSVRPSPDATLSKWRRSFQESVRIVDRVDEPTRMRNNRRPKPQQTQLRPRGSIYVRRAFERRNWLGQSSVPRTQIGVSFIWDSEWNSVWFSIITLSKRRWRRVRSVDRNDFGRLQFYEKLSFIQSYCDSMGLLHCCSASKPLGTVFLFLHCNRFFINDTNSPKEILWNLVLIYVRLVTTS